MCKDSSININAVEEIVASSMIVSQINEISESGVLVSDDRIHQINSLLNEIKESLDKTERLTKKNISVIYSLVSNENELNLLRKSIRKAFMLKKENTFFDEYEQAKIIHGKHNIPVPLKKMKKKFDASFNNKWLDIKKDYREYVKSHHPQPPLIEDIKITTSPPTTAVDNELVPVEELDINGSAESTSSSKKRRLSTRNKNSVNIYSPLTQRSFNKRRRTSLYSFQSKDSLHDEFFTFFDKLHLCDEVKMKITDLIHNPMFVDEAEGNKDKENKSDVKEIDDENERYYTEVNGPINIHNAEDIGDANYYKVATQTSYVEVIME